MHIPSFLFLKALLFILCVALILPYFAIAVEDTLPDDLRQWVPWVLYDQEERMCSLDTDGSNKRYCSWPSKLDLDAKYDGAQFTQNWFIEARSLVSLPGNSPFWPDEVQSNGKAILVSKHRGRPAVWLGPGKHIITGEFSWDNLPESLLVPPATGIVKLTLAGKTVKNPQIDQQGRLWFSQKQGLAENTQDSLGIQVFRKIEDGVPLMQQLVIQLTVSGSPRQIILGLLSDAPFVPLELSSQLPVRLDNKGRIQLQARPGQWEVRLKTRNITLLSPQTLDRGIINGPWPEEEIWVFAANPKLRQIEIKGLTPVDPSRTSLPEEWKTFPAYLIKGDSIMTFHEKNRGNPSPVPNRLQLKRELWLDEQGLGLTVNDTLTGTMTRGWRLNVDHSQSLGKVDVAGRSRLITKLESSEKIGIEVRQGSLALHAESRINRAVNNGRLELPALGWDHDFQHLSAVLNLPPGWKLLSSSGVDKVSTWLNRWTLLDIFLVLITGLATAKILGIGWGAVAVFFLLFSYHQPGAPQYLWLPLLALLSIRKNVAVKKGARLCQIGGLAILTVIIVGSIPYMIHEIRVGLYPQLEYGDHYRIAENRQMYNMLTQTTQPGQALIDEEAMDSAIQQSSMLIKSKVQKGQGQYLSAGSSVPEDKPKSFQIDPQERIQTGPGLPEWNWEKVQLSWNGPVTPEQNISFVFLSPKINTSLAFVRVLLLTLLIGGFLRHYLFSGETSKKHTKAASLALLFGLLLPLSVAPQIARAEIPSQEMLTELQTRLLKPPECGRQCAVINSCTISIDNDILTVELQLDALSRAAVPLPGKDRFFDSIILNNKKSPTLRMDSRSYSLLRVELGSHVILLKKDLQGHDKFSFSFPLLPERGQALLNNWALNGLHKDGRLDKQISLKRNKPLSKEENTAARENTFQIPAFVLVERTLHMGLKWTVSTKIIRKSPETVIALDVPLLPGEQVTTGSLHIQNGHVRINMGSEQNSFTYFSAMDPVEDLTLTAEKTSLWTEVWLLDVSPIWHLETNGFPEINQTTPAGKRYPEYHPYPGESLQLTISRPVGVPGPTMTVNRSKQIITPGLRSTATALHFSLTASRGLQHTITLPPGIDLQKSLINGKEFSLQLENNTLILPVQPGKQNVEIGWQSKQGVDTKLITDPVDLGVESVNASIELTFPASRWILLTGGPQIGPAVLFWGEMLVIILFALLLGRIKLTPLSTLQWLLLSLGLSQIPAGLAVIVVAWLLLLGLRKNHGREITQVGTFNAVQVLLVLLTLVALAVLYSAIQQGLLGHPDMQIGGNGSNGHTLRWYQDRASSTLPVAWVISVPLLAYRISMLLWALWLAVALLRWLRWGWDCFSDDSLWKKSVPRKKTITNTRRKTTPSTKSVSKNKDVTTGKQPKKEVKTNSSSEGP